MSRLVRPQTLRGFRDLLPQEMLLRNEVVGRIRTVYESYGYAPIDTPILESLSTLMGTGGEEADAQIFYVEAHEEDRVGMRFDLTVPFARLIAQYHPQDLRLPFRRYHVGPVFRADDPQPEQGRFRQFTQFDIDVAGTSEVSADAEIVAVMSHALKSLGLDPAPTDHPDQGYYIRVNNRKLVDAFLAGEGIVDPTVARHVLRVMDKSEKISGGELRAELGGGRTDASGDRIRGVGLSESLIDSLMAFAGVIGDTRADVLKGMGLLIRPSRLADDALREVEDLLSHLEALGVEERAARLDPSLARGLAYYTGTVYEGALAGGGVGSVIGGGRYDGLVSRFKDDPVPAVGASIGLDRLVTGLVNLGLELGTGGTTTRVLVLVMPGVPAHSASRVAAELRAGGVPAELYVGDAVGKTGKQLAYANALKFDVAIMLGAKELDRGEITIKDLKAGNASRAAIEDNEGYRAAGSSGQQTVARAAFVESVKAALVMGGQR